MIPPFPHADDVRRVRTTKLLSNGAYFSKTPQQGGPQRVVERLLRNLEAEHRLACLRFENEHADKLDTRFSPYTESSSRDCLFVDAREYARTTFYVLVPSRAKRLRRWVRGWWRRIFPPASVRVPITR